MKGRVLIIAGSDSGGGAGIQADIKAITALGGFAMTAVTALTAQNTHGVHGVMRVPQNFIRQQVEVVVTDLGADVIKTGMMGDVRTIKTVCEALDDFAPHVPLVVDPVMVAKGGHSLLARAAIATLRERLLPRALVITPNLPEAETLTGMTITTITEMRLAARALVTLGAPAVLLKGGHLPGDTLTDILATPDGLDEFSSSRIPTKHTHGTGCTTASAIAAGLAQGMTLHDAVTRARTYVRAAIASAPGFGGGHGPLDHAVTLNPSLLGS